MCLIDKQFDHVAVVHLKPLRDTETVSALQDQAHFTLSRYIDAVYPAQPCRFGKLLLMLPALSAVRSDTIEDLFFRKAIGRTPIEQLLTDMYKSADV